MYEVYHYISDCLIKLDLLRRRMLKQALGGVRLHPSQLAILDYIRQHAECTQAEIAENMTLTPAAITLATQRLQKDRLIEKQVNPNNLRQNILTLTEEGMTYWEKSESVFRQVNAAMFQGFSGEELACLQQYLDRIAMNITGEDTNEVSFGVINALAEQVCGSKHPEP